MALFAPGVAQGALGAMEYQRQTDIDKQLAAQRKQAMDYQAYQMETSRAQEAARLRNAEQAGSLLTPPPPVTQTPSPGQSSQPMQPPGMRPPAPPMFTQGQGMGQQPPPQMMTPGAQQAMQPQPQPIPPYRSLNGQQGMPQPNPQARGDAQPPGAPPPVGGTGMGQPSAPAQSPVGMLEQLITRMDQQGIPPADRVGVLAQLSPILKENASEQLMQMREQGVQFSQQMKNLELMLKEANLKRLEGADAARIAQGDKRLEQGQERINLKKGAGAGGGAADGKSPTDAMDAMAWQYLDTRTLPYRKGKGGANDPNTQVIQRATEIAKSLGKSVEEMAAMPAEFKSSAQSLAANQKIISTIEPYNEMVKKNGQILKDLSRQAVSTGSPWVNQKLNWLKTHPTSDPVQTKMLAQMVMFQAEAARVVQSNPNLAGQLTDTARGELEKVINGDMSAETIASVVDLLSADGDRRVSALYDQNAKLKGSLHGKSAGGGGSANDPLGIR